VGGRLDTQSTAIAYTGDTGPDPLLAELGRGVDLYIVDATDRPGDRSSPTATSSRPPKPGSGPRELERSGYC